MPRPSDCKPWLRAGLFSVILLTGLLGSRAFETAPSILQLPANSTDAEIQHALDSLPPNGEVHLGPGTYEIRQPLRLRHDYQTLRGSGPDTILHLGDKADCPIVILGPDTGTPGQSASHLYLADLTIDGNRSKQDTEFWRAAADGSVINNNGVQVWNASDVVVDHVVCCHCRSGGLVAAEVRRLQVSEFDAFDNQYDGLACYQTEQSRFSGMRLHDNLAAGISLDLAFNHNVVADSVLTANDLGVFMRDSCDNVFEGLTISGSHNHGVFMAQTATDTAKGWQLSPGTECVGNVFAQLTVNDCGGQAFRVNDASCTNNAISGASFSGNLRGGLAQPGHEVVAVRELVER